jgi:hypothetical protein
LRQPDLLEVPERLLHNKHHKPRAASGGKERRVPITRGLVNHRAFDCPASPRVMVAGAGLGEAFYRLFDAPGDASIEIGPVSQSCLGAFALHRDVPLRCVLFYNCQQAFFTAAY